MFTCLLPPTHKNCKSENASCRKCHTHRNFYQSQCGKRRVPDSTALFRDVGYLSSGAKEQSMPFVNRKLTSLPVINEVKEVNLSHKGHIHMHTHTCLHTRTHTPVLRHTTHTCANANVYIHTTDTCLHTCIPAHMHTCTHTCVNVHIHTHLYIPGHMYMPDYLYSCRGELLTC